MSSPSWFARAWQQFRAYTNPPLLSSDKKVAAYFNDGYSSYSGMPVSYESAFTYSFVYDAVNIISSDVAKLPLSLRKRTDNGGSEDYKDSKVFDLLKNEPNPEMGAMTFRQTLTAHALTLKGGFAEIVRDGLRRPSALWIITPDRIQVKRDRKATGEYFGPVYYLVDGRDRLNKEDVLHIHGLGYDGYCGYPLIELARNVIGTALAAERYAGQFFSNGGAIPGILSSEDDYPDEEQEKAIRESLAQQQSEAGRFRRFLILMGRKWKFDRIGSTPQESQMDTLRDQQGYDVARFFNLPPHKLALLDRATNNNIEQQDMEYYKGCLLNWLIRWEEELNRKLIFPSERRQQFFKHNANAFLRADIKSRFEAYSIALDKGLYNRNEVRELEDMNPQDGQQGKLYLVQSAQVPLSKIEELADAQIKKDSQPPQPPQPPSGDTSGAAGDPNGRSLEAIREELKTTQDATTAAWQAVTEAREKIAALEASGTAKDSEIDARRQAETDALTKAMQSEQTCELLRQKVAEAEAQIAAANEKVTAAESDVLNSIARATAAEERATAAEAERDMARHDREMADQRVADADERVKIAAMLAEEAAHGANEARVARGLSDAERDRAEGAANEALETLNEMAEIRQQAEHDAEMSRQKEAKAVTDLADANLMLDLVKAELAEVTERALAAENESQRQKQAADEAERHRLAAEAEKALRTQAEAGLESVRGEFDAFREQDDRGVAALIAAFRDERIKLVSMAIERETDRARLAQRSPEKMEKWLETFYDQHEIVMRDRLEPAIRIHLAFIRSTDDPKETTRRLVQAHCTESIRQIRTVLDGDAPELAQSLSALFNRWDTERASVIADALMQRELEYVRAR